MGIRLPKRKANDPRCHCVDGHYECGHCEGTRRQRIWNQMTPEQRNYDRMVDPINSAALDHGRNVDVDAFERGCTCHISPPCSYCVGQHGEG